MTAALDAAGWAGAAALLVGYVLVSMRRLAAHRGVFQWLNLLGSAGLAASSAWHRAFPSVALNAIWMIVGIATLVRGASGRGRAAPAR